MDDDNGLLDGDPDDRDDDDEDGDKGWFEDDPEDKIVEREESKLTCQTGLVE